MPKMKPQPIVTRFNRIKDIVNMPKILKRYPFVRPELRLRASIAPILSIMQASWNTNHLVNNMEQKARMISNPLKNIKSLRANKAKYNTGIVTAAQARATIPVHITTVRNRLAER
jgi:hypothetical protein